MAIGQPQSTDPQNNPDHALSHRVFANDDAAPVQSIVVDSNGDVKTTGRVYLGDATPIFSGTGMVDGDCWVLGRLQVGSGLVSRAEEWGTSLFTTGYTGLGTPNIGTGTFDLTGGTYEKLFTATTQTGGWVFAVGDIGKVIILTSGSHIGAVAIINEFISTTQVILETCGWDADVTPAVSFIFVTDYMSFTSPFLKINNIGPTCEWENVARSHTGLYVSKFDTTAAATDVTNIRVVTDAAGYSNVDSLQIKHVVGTLSAGELQKVIRVTIDDSLCTGGSTSDIEGIKFTRTRGDSTAHVDGVSIGTGFTNAVHVSGSPEEDIGYGYSFTVAYAVTDRTAAFKSSASNVQIFTAVNTGILIGSDNKFSVIKYVQNIAGSTTITPTWQYSTGDGTWATLIVSDTTTGMSVSGKIAFTIPSDWAKSEHCNESTGVITSAYYVRIIRTKISLGTPPTESYFSVFQGTSATDTLIRGDGTIKPSQLADGSAVNDSIYYSTTQSKLVYKDLGGVVRVLY
jgi:hypothetical protein